MQARVEKVYIDENKRMIAISDIHGNLDGLKQLLKKIDFNQNDVLFLVGDIVEKGKQSLDTLHYIMDLYKTHRVRVVCGNCDAIANEIFIEKDNKGLLSYLLWRKNSLLNEMCEAISIKLTAETDMMMLKKTLRENFSEELSWIRELPDIIETQKFIFVHAGLTSNNLNEQKATKVRKLDAFLKHGLSFDKYCIVGHWPVVLYSKHIPNCNPIIDREHKIICIDGGNVLKRDGQLNAFIIPNINSEDFDFISQDNLEHGIVLNSQVATENTICIPWIDNKIQILKKEEEFSYCEHSSSKNKLWILNKYIFKEKDGYHCEDSTNYQIVVNEGDIVKIIETTKKGYFVKKDGISGWYFGQLKIDGEVNYDY